jgi:uncharacterized membrane protein
MPQSNQPESQLPGSKSPGWKWNDQRVEGMLATLLQTGVIISGVVVLAGGVLYLLRYGQVPAHYETFDAQRGSLRDVLGVMSNAWHGDGRAIIQCGLLLLIATPVARVFFSMIAFALQKDRLYVLLTLIVLMILLYSLLGGAA